MKDFEQMFFILVSYSYLKAKLNVCCAECLSQDKYLSSVWENHLMTKMVLCQFILLKDPT